MNVAARLTLLAGVALLVLSSAADPAGARPSSKSGKGGGAEAQRFLRQRNTYSNVSFYYTNRGVLFNNDNVAGLTWPRGSGDVYIFGGGLWFATKKEIQGRRRKLCELGYNPNSGAGWYMEGEKNELGNASDAAAPDVKYISYVSTRYDKSSGKFIQGSSTAVPPPYYPWPLWDTSTTKNLKENFYFGDYISNVGERQHLQDRAGAGDTTVKPAMISEEDIFNIYTDADVSNNPEYRANTGYPFGLDIQEVIYTWSFGRYRDMIFVRHKVTNRSNDPLYDCWIAPAFDPDLGPGTISGQDAAGNDHNSFVSDTVGLPAHANLPEPYASHPSLLNMGYQWSAREQNKEFGMVGFSFLESPVINPSNGDVIPNDSVEALGGYGPNSLYQTAQLGLKTFKKWTIRNDPSTGDLRYDFVSSGALDPDLGIEDDMRLLFATGPFTLKPGKSVETTVGIVFAHPSTTSKDDNFRALLELSAFAHEVFGKSVIDSVVTNPETQALDTFYSIRHFLSPVPPDIPNLTGHSLDRAVLLTWDSTAERTKDPLSSPQSQPFLGYQLWRTTRSDRDSSIRPDGVNPNVLLGQWQRFNFKTDSVWVMDTATGRLRFSHLHYTRIDSTSELPIPHSYLDVGDDNHDGIISGNEGLINGVKYYYYLLAYDEYDSVQNIGPLFTAVVPGSNGRGNFISEVPTKPAYVNPVAPLTADLPACTSGGIKSIRLDVVDTARFLQLYSNDDIKIRFQPRWVEQSTQYLDYSALFDFVEVTDSKGTINLTYTRQTNPYYFWTGIRKHVPGTEVATTSDSTVVGSFTTGSNDFAPDQLVGQAFHVLVDFQFKQLSSPYKLRSIKITGSADPSIIRLSRRTALHRPNESTVTSLEDIDTAHTRPAFVGALGEATYEMTFGQPVAAPISGADANFPNAQAYPVTVKIADCAAELGLATKAENFTTMYNVEFYSQPHGRDPRFAAFTDPDTLKTPNPGWFVMDAYHYGDDAPIDQRHTAPFQITTTHGNLYWPLTTQLGNSEGGIQHLVEHRLRLAGAEILFNAPGISVAAVTGDTLPVSDPKLNDFQPGDKVTISFTGLAKGLPFPQQVFTIHTPSGDQYNANNAALYNDAVLDQVEVVPNPYIVTHEGQTTTDNAKLYFTRLPPRATIEIYALDGTLVKTIEHYGFEQKSATVSPDAKTTTIEYDFDKLGDRYSMEEWNLLTSGKQRVGSQVLIARIIGKRADGSVTGETTRKFAIVVGGTRTVR